MTASSTDLTLAQAEYQRMTLIEHVGDCERILNTPLPRVYSIEIRRSIALFLVTLTFALLSKDLGWGTFVLGHPRGLCHPLA